MPRVSVVLSSYNHEKYIGAAIESVLNQTFSDFELIISDDCSTDRTWEIIQSYTDPRIKAVRAPKNARTQTFYAAVQMASGDYLAVHHSDDLWLPEKLEEQVRWLDAHPETVAVFTRVAAVDEDGKIITRSNYCDVFEQKNRSRQEWLRHFFYHGNCICHPSAMLRNEFAQSLYTRFGPTGVNDFRNWIITCLHSEIYILQSPLTLFRIHTNNDSGSRPGNMARHFTEMPLVLESFRSISSTEDWVLTFPELCAYVINGEFEPDYAFARLCLKQADKPSNTYFGLHLLMNILDDSEKRARIERLYGFSTAQMACLIRQYDPFDITNRLAPTGYFVPCIGGQPAWEKSHAVSFHIAPDGAYSVTMNFSDFAAADPIDAVIFCPRQTLFCTNKITNCLVNDIMTDAVAINADQEFSTALQDFFVFNTPQYQIVCKKINNGTIVISGNFSVLHDFSDVQSRYLRLNALAELERREALIKTLPLWKQVCYSIAINGARLTAHKIVNRLKLLRIKDIFWKFKNKISRTTQIRIDGTNPCRIILVAHDMHRGGAQLALLNLARELSARHAMQIQILTLQGGPLIADFEQLGCQVHLLDLPFSLTEEPLPPSVNALLASLEEHKFDKAIANTVISGKLTKALKERGVHVISLVHEMPNIISKLNLTKNARQLARYSDHVVFGGGHVRKSFPYREEIAKKTAIIGQGSSVPVFVSDKLPARTALRKSLNLPENTFIVVGCGVGEPRKGIDYFAETLASIVEQCHFAPYFLWIGGFCDGALKKNVLDLVRRHGLQERFMVLDFQKDIIPFFTGADLFFLSSREDPFPTVVLDAMRLGLPCLSFRGSGGAEEMLDDGRGMLVPCFDVGAAATAICKFAELPADKRNELVLAGQRYAEKFTPERYAQQLLQLFGGKS